MPLKHLRSWNWGTLFSQPPSGMSRVLTFQGLKMNLKRKSGDSCGALKLKTVTNSTVSTRPQQGKGKMELEESAVGKK